MSTTIDERVVSMQFDNQHFEKNVQTSLGTLDKLKQSLNLTGASKGLENIDAAARNVKFTPLTNAVESVGLKFSAMQIMATTALANITNSAVNAGKRIVSALTIDPIKMGFSEYETQINAVQTILANTESKGKTLDDVNGALDELNTYADKTIYNFTEMTRNIGTFTAAGVDLDTSVAAIKGIANLAAVSGSTSQQASTAMYQLSQALASGTVKLMDWNSVVNAGMGGQVFQDALKETARVHGIAIDDLIAKEGSFRETLQHGWLSSEILTETLSKFTGDLTEEQLKSMGYTDEQIKGIIKMGQTANDAATKVKTFSQLFDTLKEAAQSGWTQTWEIIVGDFEEAKELLTKVSDVIGEMIGSSAEARNELLENWKVLGGRDDLIKSISNAFDGLMSIIKPVKEAFREIFPPLTAEQLVGFTAGLKELTSKFKLSDSASDKLKRTFKGLFAILDIVRQLFVAVVKAGASLFGIVGELGGGILGVTASFGDWLVALNDNIKYSGIFNKVLQGVVEVIKAAFKGISSFAKFVKTKFVSPGLEIFQTLLEKISENMAGAGGIASSMRDGVVNAFDAMGRALEQCSLFKILQSVWNVMVKIGSGIAKVLGSLVGSFASSFNNGGFQGVLDFINSLIAGGLGIGLINLIRRLRSPLEEFGGFIEGLREGVLGILDGFRGTLESYQDKLKSEALMKIAQAIAILTASLLVLSLIDPEKLGTAIGAITTLFAELLIALSIVNKINKGKGLVSLTAALVGISAGMLLLAVATKILSTMSWSEMGVGLISIAVGLGALVAAVNLLPETKVNKAAAAIKKMSSAMLILAVAIKIMSTMSWSEMGVGLITMVVGLGAMVGAINLLPASKVTGSAFAITLLASAMLTLSIAMKIMSTMSWGEMAKGLVATVGGLAALVAAVRLLPRDTALKSMGLVGLATSMVILSGALKIMATMSWEDFAKGMATIGGSILILSIGLNAMKGALAGAAAMVVATAALAALTPVLVILGGMSWDSILRGLTAIAGGFLVIGVAGALLKGVLPSIIGLAGAMALLGIGVLAAGVGLLAFGTGLTAVAVGFTALVGSLGAVTVGIVKIVEAFVVGLIKGIGNGIVAFCEVIANSATAIGDAIKALILAACDVLVECVPVLADTCLKLIVGLLDSLGSYTPQIVAGLFNFVIGLLNGLADHIPDFIQALFNIVSSIFTGVIEALNSVDPDTLIKGILSVGLMAGVIAALAAITPLIPGAMAGVLGMGVVIAELSLLLAAIGALAQIPGLTWLINEGGKLLESVGTAIGGLIGGIVGGIAKGITSSLPDIGTDLSNFMTNIQPFIEGASMIDPSAMDGVKSLVGVILSLTGANILERLTSWLTGGSSLTKFGEELAAFAPSFRSYADTISGIDPTVVTASACAAKALAEMTNHIPNSGGVVSWFAGDNSITAFSDELPILGQGLKGFSDSVSGINIENIIAASNAAKTLAEMTNHIPNSGGVMSWLAGENSIANFSSDLVLLGMGLKGFSDAIVGVNPENVTAASNAAKALAEMTNHIPNSGGVASWFSGDNSISKFSGELPKLGQGLKGFSDQVVGINPENVTAAANAAKALAEMTNHIPNSGGVGSWFAGDNSLSKFSTDLVLLGMGLKGFADQTNGVNPESVTAAANAAKALAEMTNHIPNSGGVVSWFSGDNSISKFSGELPKLGKGLKGFSTSIEGINAENISAAANAAKALAEMTQHVPKEGGIKSWFTGETSIANFADKLPKLGEGLKGFSESVEGINAENLTAASNAAKAIAEMTGNTLPNVDKMPKLAENLVTLGSGMKTCFSKLGSITPESISSTKNAVNAVEEVTKLDSGKTKSMADALDDLTDSIKNLSSIPKNATAKFSKALSEMGKTSADALLKAFKDIESDMEKAGQNTMSAFIEGLKSKSSAIKKACESLANSCVSAIKESKSKFSSAGSSLVDGFASGISSNSYKAAAKARAMAKAAAKAAEDELDINSPSKVFRAIGYSIPEGFAMGIDKLSGMASDSAVSMAKDSVDNVRNTISRIAEVINSDIDAQPTIRPVLDLSEVRSGANSISGLFGTDSSIGVLTNVGTISSAMKKYNRNEDTSQLISEISKLRKDLAESDRAIYNVNGVTYDDGSSVSEAIKTLVRAAIVERRL